MIKDLLAPVHENGSFSVIPAFAGMTALMYFYDKKR
jgi:hypothetical protein